MMGARDGWRPDAAPEASAAEAARDEGPSRSQLFEGYPDLLTPSDIAELTGLSVQTVRGLCRSYTLPAVHIGGRSWYVPKPLFIDFVMGEGHGGR